MRKSALLSAAAPVTTAGTAGHWDITSGTRVCKPVIGVHGAQTLLALAKGICIVTLTAPAVRSLYRALVTRWSAAVR